MKQKIIILISIIILLAFSFCNNKKTNYNQESDISPEDSIKIIELLDTLKASNIENIIELPELINNVEKNLEEIVPTSQLPEYYNKIGLIFFEKSNYKCAEDFFYKAYIIQCRLVNKTS